MRKPFPDPNLSVADPDDDNDLLGGKTVKARHDLTAHIFATEALDAALTRKARSLLKRESGIYILHLPHQSWVKHFERPVRNLNGGVMPRGVTGLEKIGGVYYRQGAEGLDIVQRGFGVMYMSQDPKNLLDEAVLAAADFTITVPPATPALMRRVIRRVTGGTARHVTPAMAQLDLSIILSIIRPDLSAWECVQNLQRAVDRQTAPPDHTVPLLAELPLTRSVRAWADQMLVDLEAVKAGALPPSALSFGLLEGPPGTGKSLIAESLAATAGWSFVPATIGGWFAQGDGALGGVAKNLRGFIDQALALEPAIAFLDEIDALPDRDTLSSRAREWWTPVVTQFLTEIDRLRKSGRKVLLLGASNYYSRLDAALVRPGRLNQRVSVLAPDTDAEVLALLRHFLGQDLTDADLDKLVRYTIGATPAAVEGLARAAKAQARSSSRGLLIQDVLDQIVAPAARVPDHTRAIALHEIGHAIVAHHLNHEIESVSILPMGNSQGRMRTTLSSETETRQYLEDVVTISLGGRAADIVLGHGANAGAESDLASATSVLIAIHERFGLNDQLLHIPSLGQHRRSSADAVEADLRRLLDRAKSIILDNRDAALALADRLVAENVLTGAEIADGLASKAANDPADMPIGGAIHEKGVSHPVEDKRALQHGA